MEHTLSIEIRVALTTLDAIVKHLETSGCISHAEIMSYIGDDLIEDEGLSFGNLVEYASFGGMFNANIQETYVADDTAMYIFTDITSVMYALTAVHPVFAILLTNAYTITADKYATYFDKAKAWGETLQDIKEHSDIVRKRRAEKQVCTYILRDSAGAYKIGRSADVINRIYSIQKYNTTAVTILILEADIEKSLHDAYATKHITGEWFRLNDTDMDNIRTTYSHIPQRIHTK